MTFISIPPDLELSLLNEAQRRGTTPELLAVDTLRQHFSPRQDENGNEAGGENASSLLDFLRGYVGTVSGSDEPLSENCGQQFSQILLTKQHTQQGESR